jgi:hypothetical protein
MIINTTATLIVIIAWACLSLLYFTYSNLGWKEYQVCLSIKIF